MFLKFHALLVSFTLIGIVFPHVVESQSVQKRANKERTISLEEARVALNKLIEDDSFLSNATFLEPLKSRIKAENKTKPLLSIAEHNKHSLGYWICNIRENTFCYNVKSLSRNELFAVRGHFVLGEDIRWTAKISEASRTALFNLFSMKEYEKIQLTMTTDEVVKILGTSPGTFFAEEASFEYPNGRRANWPFTGSGKDFQKKCPWFFNNKLDSRKGDWIDRAWISNEIAIWITFDVQGKVHRKSYSEVRFPNEEDDLSKYIEQLIKENR